MPTGNISILALKDLEKFLGDQLQFAMGGDEYILFSTTRALVQRSHASGPQTESGLQKCFVRYVLCFSK